MPDREENADEAFGNDCDRVHRDSSFRAHLGTAGSLYHPAAWRERACSSATDEPDASGREGDIGEGRHRLGGGPGAAVFFHSSAAWRERACRTYTIDEPNASRRKSDVGEGRHRLGDARPSPAACHPIGEGAIRQHRRPAEPSGALPVAGRRQSDDDEPDVCRWESNIGRAKSVSAHLSKCRPPIERQASSDACVISRFSYSDGSAVFSRLLRVAVIEMSSLVAAVSLACAQPPAHCPTELG